MNKVGLVGAVAQRTNMTKVDAEVVVNAVFQTISDTLVSGER